MALEEDSISFNLIGHGLPNSFCSKRYDRLKLTQQAFLSYWLLNLCKSNHRLSRSIVGGIKDYQHLVPNDGPPHTDWCQTTECVRPRTIDDFHSFGGKIHSFYLLNILCVTSFISRWVRWNLSNWSLVEGEQWWRFKRKFRS